MGQILKPACGAFALAALLMAGASRADDAPATPATPAETAPAENLPQDAVATVPVAQPPSEPVDSGTAQLDDITVTAQKRVQTIKDVPISITAMTGQMLWEQGATDIREALQFVPNARVDSAGFFAAPRVRGFTLNNNNKSFEPPVGMVLDGIPHTRVEYFLAALMDVERMEVLRGPQGTSFGKNTTAGLIHLIANPASSEPQGVLTLETGQADRRRIEAAYGGPLTDGLNFRVAGLLDERGGFIENTTARVLDTAPKEIKDRRRTGLRLTLEMPELFDDSLLVLAHEQYDLHDGGAALESVISSGPNFRDAVRLYDPGADFIPGNWVQSQDYPDYKDVTIERTRFQFDHGLGEWDMVAIGAYSVMTENLSIDTDFTPAPAILGSGRDRSPDTYAELRFTAPPLGGLLGLSFLPGDSDLLFGVSGGRRQILDSHFQFAVGNEPFFALVGAAAADVEGAPGPIGDAGGIFSGAPQAGVDKLDQLDQRFNQVSDELSGFAHVQYRFLPAWAVELGGRYTTEKKHADWDLVFTTPEPNTSLRAIGAEPFTATRRLDLANFQPKVSLNWEATADISTYLHWEKGYKAGGFNAFALREGTCDPANPADVDCMGFADDDLTFKDEVATNVGFDFKSWWLDHSMAVNVSLFREVATDFQVLIRENPQGTIGQGTSRVVNAEEALSQGVEADLRWLAAPWLTVNSGVGVLDTDFVSFKQGECPVGTSHKDADGDGLPACDQSGKPFPFAPRFSGALGLRLNLPLDGLPAVGPSMQGLLFAAGTVAEYESEQYLDIDLEDKKLQHAYTRFRADVGVSSVPHRWTVRLVGENLTNTVTWVRMGDVFENNVHGSQNQPRLMYLQFRQEF